MHRRDREGRIAPRAQSGQVRPYDERDPAVEGVLERDVGTVRPHRQPSLQPAPARRAVDRFPHLGEAKGDKT